MAAPINMVMLGVVPLWMAARADFAAAMAAVGRMVERKRWHRWRRRSYVPHITGFQRPSA